MFGSDLQINEAADHVEVAKDERIQCGFANPIRSKFSLVTMAIVAATGMMANVIKAVPV